MSKKRLRILERLRDDLHKDDLKKGLEFLLPAGLYCCLMAVTGMPCPIRYFSGISCAGCGMTRAWISLLKLDLAGAFHYHPLFWLPAVVLVVWLYRRRLSPRVYQYIVAGACVFYLLVYLWRMLHPQDKIVVFEPEKGAICGVIRFLLR